MEQRKYPGLRRKRILVETIGFIVGFLLGIPITYMLYGWPVNFTTFSCGLAGAALALLYAERKRRLPTREDVEAVRFEEGLKPLSLATAEKVDKKDNLRHGVSR